MFVNKTIVTSKYKFFIGFQLVFLAVVVQKLCLVEIFQFLRRFDCIPDLPQ